MGVPGHDERDFEFALKNSLRITTGALGDGSTTRCSSPGYAYGE